MSKNGVIAEHLYQLLPEIMPDALVVTNEQGRIVLTNTLAEELFGYTSGELINQQLEILVPKRYWTSQPHESLGRTSDLECRSLVQGQEYYGIHKNGREFPIDISLRQTKTEYGTFIVSSIRAITVLNQTERELRQRHKTPEQLAQERNAKLVSINEKLRTEITEHKHSEEILRTTQASLKLAVHAANVGLWDWDLITNQVYLSPEWKHQLGCEDHEIANSFEEWECRLHPNDHERMLSTIRSYIANPWPDYKVEFRLKHKDGSYRWILTHASLMRDSKGKPYRMLGSHIDITEQKKSEQALRQSHELLERQVQERTAALSAINEKLRIEIGDRKRIEEALRESEHRYQDLYDNAPDMYFAVSEDATIQSLNLFGAEYLGFNREELVGEEVWGIIHPDDSTRIRRQVGDIFGRGIAKSELEFRKVRKDGSVIWVHEQAKLIAKQGNAPAELRIICRDISERKRAEEALRKSEEQVRLLMDSVAEGIYGLDLNGVCTSCNSAALRLLGYQNVDEVLGRNMHELIHHTRANGAPYPLSECPICEAFQRSERSHVVDEVLWRSDNTCFPAEYWSYPVLQNGKLVGAVVTFLDITERKLAEEALQKAKEEAELANAAKSRFLAAVSHDLRQPLQTLSLLVGILKKTDTIQGPVKEVINDLEKTMFFMGDLLDTLSDINRLRSDFSPRVTDISVAGLLNRMKIRFEHQAKKKGLELHVVPCGATIYSDPTLLERMVQNCLSNAIKYTTRGKVLLGCRRRSSRLRIEIWDTGPGIPEKQRSMIFEEYYQLDNPARSRQKGLGLGLSIVDRGARHLGHLVEVHSTVGKGSVFSIEVPLVKK